jgi:hypothetical protein
MSTRERSEIETDRDMDKPVEQLVCDVHEETHSDNNWEGYSAQKWLGNIAAAQKRFASLMAKVALSNDKVASRMLYLTWAIFILTVVLVILAAIPFVFPPQAKP